VFNRTALILLAALAGAPLLILASFQFEKLRQTKFMQLQLAGKAAELDRQLDRLSVLPGVLSTHPHVVQVLQNKTPENLTNANQSLLQAQKTSRASFAFVMDSQGTTVASSNFQDAVSFVGVNYGFRPYFQQAMSSNQATFFAVGATTGIPGYFVANSVQIDGETKGVVVVKAELAGLFDAWRLSPYEWLALDELGVVILSTKNEFLYSATRKLTEQERQKISNDRRYIPAETSQLEFNVESTSPFAAKSSDRAWYVQNRLLTTEAWQLILVVERSWLLIRALYYVLAIGSLLTIIALIYRNLLTQKRLATTEHRHAHELEIEVEERTRQLRSTQKALITESNFAMLGRMSAAINHEVNQPLASLRLNLASLRKVIDQPDANVDEVRQIVIDSDRTTKRIGRVVTTLRTMAGRKPAEHGYVHIDRLVTEVVETIQRERPSMSQVLKTEIANADLLVSGDEVLLQQALLNLIYNAFDAVLVRDKPSVFLDVYRRGESVALDVVDNGAGVSDEIEPALFKPFATDKGGGSGLGLGLTLAKMIADEHGGQLLYFPLRDSVTQESAGSVFALNIPLANTRTANSEFQL